MWGSSVTRRRQKTVIAEMVAHAGRTDDFTAPWRAVPELWEFFSDETAVLRHLQQHWRTSLAGEVYVAIDAGDGDLQADVMKAYDRTRRRHLGVRLILEANQDHPAIAAAMRKEQSLLSAVVAALPTDAAAAVLVA